MFSEITGVYISMKTFASAFAISITCLATYGQDKLLSPEEFLGYELGQRFTLHSNAVEYYKHVSSVSANAELFTYGETYEGRPLTYLVITSPENFPSLEEIRLDNLRRAGLAEGTSSGRDIAIVWLSYNVHGNEASSMEASMITLYDLANPENEKSKGWLKNTVVIMDPCVNPDGRDRYANYYNQYGNSPPNASPDAFEHHEPWPGGRSNHYFFDLNRDWAWCTQIESQQRIKAYNRWLPHVHVDFHEQGYNSPYFFAPAAEPLHEVISDWQREFQLTIGKNNARYFDQKGWLYFTKEVFDLYYPSYGDTYPTYSGAVGMTYEQAGGGTGGLEIETRTGDPLTLADRIMHHHTTGLATIEITSMNAERVTEEFARYFSENNNIPAATYKTYVIKAENNPDRVQQLTDWLDLHAVRYGHTGGLKTVRGFKYRDRQVASVTVSPQDIVIPVDQPKSRFLTTIFEPSSKLSDSLTYDITAWNLLYGYNLDAYALTERLAVETAYRRPSPPTINAPEKPYAYIFKYESVKDVAFLSALMKHKIKVRSARKSFAMNGNKFAPGTLVVTRVNNETNVAFDSVVLNLASDYERKTFTAKTGLVDAGRDLGSGDLSFIKMPRIAVLFGEQTTPPSVGELWHFFEQQIGFPITHIGSAHFKNIRLDHYDVLVVPEGSYKIFDEATLEEISAWVTSGGKLILIGDALNAFVDKKGFNLKSWSSDTERAKAEEADKTVRQEKGFARYEEVERKQLSGNISGAIYKVAIDNSHPVAFGLEPFYYTLKTHSRRFAWLNNGWNIAYFKNEVKPIQGFAGFKANAGLRNSLLLGIEEKGTGEVIYFVDNPLFRSFWEQGKMLFSNAVFLVGQ